MNNNDKSSCSCLEGKFETLTESDISESQEESVSIIEDTQSWDPEVAEQENYGGEDKI